MVRMQGSYEGGLIECDEDSSRLFLILKLINLRHLENFWDKTLLHFDV